MSTADGPINNDFDPELRSYILPLGHNVFVNNIYSA